MVTECCRICYCFYFFFHCKLKDFWQEEGLKASRMVFTAPETPLLWCRWIARRPGMIFGVGVTVHVSFLVITAILFVAKYPILPFVFDDLPLENNNDVMFKRAQAWTHRNNQLEPSSSEKREKRSLYMSDNVYDIQVDLHDVNKYLQQPELILAPLRAWSSETPDKNIEDYSFLGNDGVSGFADMYLRNVDEFCSLQGSGRLFDRKSCFGDPNSRDARIRRDTKDDLVLEREYTLTSLRLIYETPGGNIFTKQSLQTIAKFENWLYKQETFQRQYCRLFKVGGARFCQPFHSVLRFFDGSYSYADEDLYDPSFTNVSSVLALAYQNEDVSENVKYFISKNSKVQPSEGVVESDRTRSIMFFGYPLKSFGNRTDNRGQQRNEWSKYAKQHLIPTLMNTYNHGLHGIKFFFMSYTLYWQEVMAQVVRDWVYILGGFCFIVLFMWFQTGSLWITFWGVGSIITSFFGANLLYNIVIDFKFFGIFNVLALFILLGIGADDIFIFTDTWRLHGQENFEKLETRLSVSFKRAAIAMLVTSLTTMVAFFVSSFSPILPIAAFGTFSGLTILVNYMSVILFFPSVVILYHKHYEQKCCCCCCGTERDSDKQKTSLNDKVVTFFKGPFFNFITHRVVRWVILACFTVLVGCAIFSASRITLAEQTFRLFGPDNLHEAARDRDRYSFLTNTEAPKLEVTLVWGLGEQDRSMCPPRRYDAINPCEGSTVWDQGFDLNDHEAQIALLDLCNRLIEMKGDMRNELRIAYDPKKGTNNVTCFIKDMAEFFKDEGQEPQYPVGSNFSLPITKETVKSIILHNPAVYRNQSYAYVSRPFEVALNFWLTHRYTNETIPDKRSKFNSYLGRKKIDNRDFSSNEDWTIRQTRLMYAGVRVHTELTTTDIGLTYGLQLMEKWNTFFKEQTSTLPAPLQNGFQFSNTWVWYRIIQTLAIQSILACGVGLALAFAVIFLGTQNIITGLVATFMLACVAICVVAIIPIAGWRFGLLESLNLCLIVGLAVDYIVHVSEAYHMSRYSGRLERVKDTLEKVGISILSGAITTLGASFFMLFAELVFFQQFGMFIFATIGFSLVFSLTVFMSLYSICGPEGQTGSVLKLCKNRKRYDEYQEERATQESSDHQRMAGVSSRGEGTDNTTGGVISRHGDAEYDNAALDTTDL